MIHFELIHIYGERYGLKLFFFFAYGYSSVPAPCVEIAHLILKYGAHNSSIVHILSQHNHS